MSQELDDTRAIKLAYKWSIKLLFIVGLVMVVRSSSWHIAQFKGVPLGDCQTIMDGSVLMAIALGVKLF